MAIENEVWPPAPACPPPQPQQPGPRLRFRLTVPAVPGPVRACFCGLGWLVLAHGLLCHLPPAHYYHRLLPLALVGIGGGIGAKPTPLQGWTWSLSMLLLFVYFGMELMHIAHYF